MRVRAAAARENDGLEHATAHAIDTVTPTDARAFYPPCGFDDAALPVGVQLAANPFGESVLYQTAAALEQQIGRLGKGVGA